MEPRIQYAKTEDGVNIAYYAIGEGEPLVQMVGPWSHLELEWQIPECRRWYEYLAQRQTLVRFDPRGFGLSDRDAKDYSLDAQVLDLEAVVDRLALDSFALLGQGHAGLVAIAHAVSHPKQVSHLLLWCSFPKSSDFWRSPRTQAFRAIRETDWELYADSLAEFGLGRRPSETERQSIAALVRGSATQETVSRFFAAMRDADVTDLLPRVRSPALVLHRRESPLLSVDFARSLASQIPGARLAVLEGTSQLPYLDDVEAVLAAIDEFIGDGEQMPTASKTPTGDTHTILFTDMEGSTTLADRLGDDAAQAIRRTHNDIVRAALSANGGSEIKHTGDGIMASFTTASSALDCAIAIQRGVAAHKDQQPDSPLSVYIGLNAGEPIAEDDDLFGTSINLAARICDRAEAGQIIAANVVRELAAGKQFLFADLGETELRGFEDPVKLWELRWS